MKVLRRLLQYLMPACCLLLVLAPLFHPGPVRADWLQDLEADAVAWMAEEGSPGMAIAIVKNDVVIYAKGFGRTSVAPTSPRVDENTVFLIGSTSKAFTSAELAILADRNQIAWTDRVGKLLPSFRMYDPWVNAQFQVEDMLTHRSGLFMYSLTMMEMLNYPSSARVKGIRFQKPTTSFRTAFAYQNCMYTAAAELVAAVTGRSWGDSLSDDLFTPLGMTRTVTSQAAVDKMTNVARGHLHLADGSLWPIPSNWFWNTIQDRSLAAGAVRTTAHDMGQWLRLHLSPGKVDGQQIVTEANMRYLHAPKVLIDPWQHNTDSPCWGSVSYCAGAWQYWGLSPQPFLYHDGGAMGSGSAIGFVPGADVGIAVLTNVEAGDYLAGKIVCRFYDLYFNEGDSASRMGRVVLANRKKAQSVSAEAEAEAASDAQTPGLPLADYCGVYSNSAYGNFVVGLSDGKLTIVMGPHKMRARLVRATPAGNRFTAYLPGYPEGYEMTMPVTFKFPSSGQATLITGPIVHDPKEVFVRISE